MHVKLKNRSSYFCLLFMTIVITCTHCFTKLWLLRHFYAHLLNMNEQLRVMFTISIRMGGNYSVISTLVLLLVAGFCVCLQLLKTSSKHQFCGWKHLVTSNPIKNIWDVVEWEARGIEVHLKKNCGSYIMQFILT